MTGRAGWDDERIGAAYRAMVERPVPAGLLDAAIARPPVARRTRPGWMLAAAAVVITAVGAGAIGAVFGMRNSLPVSTEPASPQTSAATLLGVPIVEVPDLVRMLESGSFDDRELFVHGWLNAIPPVMLRCAAPAFDPGPLEERCGSDLVLLLRDPERIYRITPEGVVADPPVGPAIRPVITETSGLPELSTERPSPAPVEVIAMGHFDDPRAVFCRPENVETCQASFVIDRILDPLVRSQGVMPGLPAAWRGVEGRADGDAYAHVAELFQTLFFVVSTGAIEGTELRHSEPAVAGVPTLALSEHVWIVRVLADDGSAGLRTFLVRDEDIGVSPRIAWELTRDGPKLVTDGPAVVPFRFDYMVLCTVAEEGCDRWIELQGPTSVPRTELKAFDADRPSTLETGTYRAIFTATARNSDGSSEVIGTCEAAFEVPDGALDVGLQVTFTDDTCRAQASVMPAQGPVVPAPSPYGVLVPEVIPVGVP